MTQRLRRAGLAERITTQCVRPGPLPLGAGTFDVVFSKDAIVQIPDKAAVFEDAYRLLRPGGWLIASDWLRGGSGPYSAEMLEYFRLEGIAYNMASLPETVAALAQAGFVDIKAQDRAGWYRDLARREFAALAGELRSLVSARIGAARTEHFVNNWRQLVLVLERGDLRPTHLPAKYGYFAGAFGSGNGQRRDSAHATTMPTRQPMITWPTRMTPCCMPVNLS